MALHERIALQAGSIGGRAELNGAEVYADGADGLRKRSFRQKSEPRAKGELQPESNPEGVDRKQFPDVPSALPPSQLPRETSCKADHRRPSVREVFFCVIEDDCKAPASSVGAGSVRLMLLSLSGEARWNVCFVTRESV
jgi:hypothetical protein